MRYGLFFIQLCLLSLALFIIAGLFYFLWPASETNERATHPILVQTSLPAVDKTQPPDPTTEIVTKNQSNKSRQASSAKLPQPQPTTKTILNYENIQPLEDGIANINLDLYKQQVSIEQYFSYLLALEKCMPFHRYVDHTGKINISPQRLQNTLNQQATQGVPTYISQSLVRKINMCNGVNLTYIERLYQEVTYVANHDNIQAMLLLSHLPDMSIIKSNHIDAQSRKNFYQKQMMWLEQARQHGSLNALFNLAVRYHHGISPDPVSAASYYQVLQHFLPEYQYGDTVTNLTDSMKTWQKAEVDQMTKLLIEDMNNLPQLYDW